MEYGGIVTLKFTSVHFINLACHHLFERGCKVVMTMSLHTEASEVVGVQDLQEEVCCSIRIGAALPHFVQQGMLNRYSKLTGLPNSILLRISL